MLRIKRTYDPPARGDGARLLVERLWPRGMTKEAVAADAWLKDVAPSTALRRWFNHQEERWDEFRRRYRKELAANPDTASIPIVVVTGTDTRDLNEAEFACVLRKPIHPEVLVYAIENCLRGGSRIV